MIVRQQNQRSTALCTQMHRFDLFGSLVDRLLGFDLERNTHDCRFRRFLRRRRRRRWCICANVGTQPFCLTFKWLLTCSVAVAGELFTAGRSVFFGVLHRRLTRSLFGCEMVDDGSIVQWTMEPNIFLNSMRLNGVGHPHGSPLLICSQLRCEWHFGAQHLHCPIDLLRIV